MRMLGGRSRYLRCIWDRSVQSKQTYIASVSDTHGHDIETAHTAADCLDEMTIVDADSGVAIFSFGNFTDR
jgi:hypothetical protein